MPDYFADTCYFFGLLSSNDQHHEAVLKVEADLPSGAVIHTSEEVLMELLNMASKRGKALRQAVAAYVRTLRDDSDVTVYELDPERFEESLSVYEKHDDKDWSLVDCSSLTIIDDFSLNRKVLTNDHHFTQAGKTTAW